MQIFLTGATGFVGQALVRALRARHWDVRALVRDEGSAPARWLADKGCALVRGDVTQAAGLAEAMARADVVLHNAGLYELGADAALRARMQQVNVQGTEHVLAAAQAAGVPRTVYVSTVWSLGQTGAATSDETHRHDGNYLTPYEESKAEAHQVALRWRERGLPLVVAMPNGVMGPNDHSAFGYFLRLYLMHRLPPMSFSPDSVYSFVDVEALADGLCRAAEAAPMGQDYLFCGEPQTIRQTFGHWNRHPGGAKARVWLPRALMRAQFALLEPLLRAAGLPAFMSRDTVAASSGSLNYSATRARRELGWSHPSAAAMWDRIIEVERKLIAARSGFLNRLRHLPVTPD